MGSRHASRGILVLDMSYTYRMYRERQADQALTTRRLDGYFDAVVSVHPLAALFEQGESRIGRPVVTPVEEGHVFVEGKLGRYRWLRRLAPLNFVLAQLDLFSTLMRLARASHVAVVRIGDPYYLGILGWLLARRLDVPLAIRVPFRYDELRRVTGRATMPRLFRYAWVEKALERWLFPRCAMIAGANADNLEYALENGGRPMIATVFRYGNLLHPLHWQEPHLRPGATAELEALGLGSRRFVATVARLEPMKRVADAIRAAAEIRRRGFDIASLIIGDGSERHALEQLAQSLNVGDAIVFAGARPQEWIGRVLPAASVILSPHMGRGLAEAALSGLPIVAFDYDWQREVVVDDETGFLVPNGDWQAMAAKACDLLAHPAEAQRMGWAARERVSRMMDPTALVAHEQTMYTELFERWQAGQRHSRSADISSMAQR